MPSKPIIVFVPGAWHLPSCFELVENLLKPAGYECIGVRTPSVRKEPPFPKDASDDVQAIRAALVTAIGEENDVVVVMHSYGGFPGSAACKGMSKEDRVKEGMKGGVVHLVYIASFAVEEGRSMGGGDKPIPADWRITEPDGYIRVERCNEIFYNDLSEEEANKRSSELQHHATGAFYSIQTYSAFKFIPSTYVICELDNAIPVALQEMIATQPGADMDIIRLKSSHSPFYSMPEETSNIIRKAAGEL
ncbi:hypothetical protein BLS_001101 [Venturia inaequalis]|uniref:AB hydrolase-1 domain-containing protein n=1 Tax=Venturia inaequalis TaxID=5025 RepID=A0A8H3YN60_VENIN|nr:hypothetical protein EG328_008488 [Venturia inaequalis]KAE9975225.1 hypothetical protein EG327_008509 [Venturia inaequalis]KAE9977822.1 hypothetical protein BLS_001101 [Venturia inaequalis]RDI85937.1 hypothetical protein Vi05172_g3966 [Venturia inaequalis]